jgi:hypothetical protein
MRKNKYVKPFAIRQHKDNERTQHKIDVHRAVYAAKKEISRWKNYVANQKTRGIFYMFKNAVFIAQIKEYAAQNGDSENRRDKCGIGTSHKLYRHHKKCRNGADKKNKIY